MATAGRRSPDNRLGQAQHTAAPNDADAPNPSSETIDKNEHRATRSRYEYLNPIVLREFHLGAGDAMKTEGDAKIVPRWEWRTFDASLNAIAVRFATALEHVAPHTSAEIYLLRLGGPQNAKIRDGILDVKRLHQVDVSGLELWEPVLKAKFPLSQNDVATAFVEWQLSLPRLGRKTYTIDQFTNELIAAQPHLRVAPVTKSRRRFQPRRLHSGIRAPIGRFVISGKLFARA